MLISQDIHVDKPFVNIGPVKRSSNNEIFWRNVTISSKGAVVLSMALYFDSETEAKCSASISLE